MDSQENWKRDARFNQSEGARRFYFQTRQIVSLQWWISRSWKFRVQFLVGLAAFLLLAISAAAYALYEYEYAKVTKNFMRLQIFGPQKIYCPSSSVPSNSASVRESEISNFCQFHIETRHPYGNVLPGVRIETEYQLPDGTPFWFHSDITGKNGTFQVPYPDMPTPDVVKLAVHAEDGRKSVDFATFLRVRREDTLHSASETDMKDESYYEARLEDVTLDSLESAPDFFPEWNFHSPAPVSMTFCDPGERLLTDRRLNLLVSSSERKYRPVFLGIWQGDLLLTCRPFIAGEKSRKVTLSLPESISGLLSLLLIDYSVLPPTVLQHELIYFPSESDEDKTAEQEKFLEKISSFMARPQYRAEKQRLEFLPMEVDNPYFTGAFEKDGSERRAEKSSGRLKFFEDTEALESSSSVQFRMKRGILDAADHLLASVLVPNVSLDDRFRLKELQEFREVCSRLDHAATSLRSEKVGDEGERTETDGSRFQVETVSKLLQKALKLQSRVLNRTLSHPDAMSKYAQDLPIVFDSLSELEQGCSEAAQFKARTRVLTSRFSCLAFSFAMCLVWMMLMASILGIPTTGRNWVLTLGVVLFAFFLSCLISIQSNTANRLESIRYETWSIDSITAFSDK